MRFLMAVILLAFPIMEIGLLIHLCQRYGWWVLCYLIIIGYLGIRLIRSEKDMLAKRLFQQLGAQGNPMLALLGVARTMFAGVLLVIPGVLTDVIAVVLLLMPSPKAPVGQGYSQHAPFGRGANDDIIEGEFSQADDRSPQSGEVIPLPKRPQ